MAENVGGTNAAGNSNRLVPPDEQKLTQPSLKKEKEDYLAKYEFHKDSGLPYFAAGNVRYFPPSPGSKALIMKDVLLGQSKVRTMIPRAPKEGKMVFASVNLNGYRLDFPKGTYIDVPKQVADVLNDSVNQTESALDNFQINTTQKEEALL